MQTVDKKYPFWTLFNTPGAIIIQSYSPLYQYIKQTIKLFFRNFQACFFEAVFSLKTTVNKAGF